MPNTASCATRDYPNELEWDFDYAPIIVDGDHVADPDWRIYDVDYVLSTIRSKGIVVGRVSEAPPCADERASAGTIEQQFVEQADKWDNETAHLSSPAQRFLHPSYVAVMGMAQDNRDVIIRLLLRDMEENRREWFWALSYLTHENPIDRRDSGNLDKMIKAWVQWGKTKGLR
jgi:hypothetical protein